MSDSTQSAPGLAQDDAGSTNLLSGVPRRVLKTLLLPMLPLLSLQRNTLPIIRAGLQRDKDDYIKTIDKFALLEIHALMMLLDPSRKLRGRLGENLEQDLAAELSKILDRLATGLINVVEVQEIILSRLIDVLKEARNEKRGNTGGAVIPRPPDVVTDSQSEKNGAAIEVILSRVADILNEVKKGTNGNTLEAIISRLADGLKSMNNASRTGTAEASISRLVETLRGKIILSRLMEGLKQAKNGKQGDTEKA